ncbi:phosphodiester glycosidase family protein [Streptacidiphilus sp. P02-A3a]|uniref:phosphodiester glycosidase family protein n=1 Tax=Streptacidiphilus sp. P02-A3a TaxID=2704468 RepID=UPI0015F85EFC|nr:phosphodiester glycosidase family protein [Streptacidiphilus sp. P02-A3a]QMU69574.1 phosphodiester glycosidase family protein [Streptacidiphilus sp. P02-A3a]
MGFNSQDASEATDPSGVRPPSEHDARAVAEGPGGPSGLSGRRRTLATWSTLALAVLVLALVVYCVHDALAAPGKQGATAKLARWGRCHHLVVVADLIDGRARTASAADYCSVTGPAVLRAHHSKTLSRPRPAVPVVPVHPPVVPLVSPAMPGEGVFSPLVRVKGQPVIQRALMRPDGYDATFPVGVVWMKHGALRFQLHPGAAEPGGSWPVPATVPPGQRTGLVATYNGGFKLSNGDSHGGFYLDGSTGVPLVDGAASEVFHRDGSLTIGVWGHGVGMAPDVVGVRQCLVPLVSGGQVTEAVHDGGADVWGLTDGGNSFVARSGVGIDRNGDILYAGGRLMSVETLATVLQRAGAVTAMMLDINLSWPSFISYDGSRTPADPVPYNLVNFVRAPTRYYDQSSRDFVAVYARG